MKMTAWRWLAAGLFAGILAIPGMAAAQKKTQDLVLTGDAKCTTCHDEQDSAKIFAIGRTRHGTIADKRVGTCTSCHGASDKHIADAEKGAKKPVAVDVAYGTKTANSAESRNAACLTCHQGGNRIHWTRSSHANSEVACSSCHQIHVEHDKARDKLTQSEVCFACHKEQRALMSRPSRHPIKEGKVACSDCHAPHGTAGVKQLVRDTVNDTCYTCHMEKRGPFLRSHEPVAEDCSICHNPHGTTNPNLLKVRAPFLCQSCHQPSSHHATVPLNGVAGAVPSTNQAVIMARGCVNCHTEIHGSNNPVDATGRGFRR
jgi:DmsE family decaheme c-type cytochrome